MEEKLLGLRARKLARAALKAGLGIGRDQAARLMRANGLRGASRAKKRFTTHPDPAAVRAPDPVNRDFTATRSNYAAHEEFSRSPPRGDQPIMPSTTVRSRTFGHQWGGHAAVVQFVIVVAVVLALLQTSAWAATPADPGRPSDQGPAVKADRDGNKLFDDLEAVLQPLNPRTWSR